ncbi:MAG: hypothetical protein ACO1N5_00940 [Noviherbaspirillum sp.]
MVFSISERDDGGDPLKHIMAGKRIVIPMKRASGTDYGIRDGYAGVGGCQALWILQGRRKAPIDMPLAARPPGMSIGSF